MTRDERRFAITGPLGVTRGKITEPLVSRTPNGDERVLATNVASYDVSPDGSIVYSNGRGIFALEPDGSSGIALRDAMVADVVAAMV